MASTINVATAIDLMAREVQHGEFTKAEAIGATSYYHLSIPKSAITINRAIYEGGQATVYEATLDPTAIPLHSPAAAILKSLAPLTKDATVGGSEGMVVALKRARIRESMDLERFREEIRLLAELSSHPGIVTLIGARLLPPDYTAVLQLEATNAEKELYQKVWRPSWGAVIRLGAHLAAAVAHMHRHNVIHRDLKPANVLLSGDRKFPKLADLGIAARIGENPDPTVQQPHNMYCSKPSGGFHKQNMVGTLEYMAPEILMKHPHTPASDIFALGVLLNELSSAQIPYSDCTRDNPLAHTILEMGYGRQELASAVAVEGLRPTIADGCPPGMAQLLKKCWSAKPGLRPSAEQVEEALNALAADLPIEEDDEDEVVGGRFAENGQNGLHHNGSIATHNAAAGTTSPEAKGGGWQFIHKDAPAPHLTGAGFATQALLKGVPNPDWVVSALQTHKQQERIQPTADGGMVKKARMLAGSFASAGLRGEDKMEDRCLVLRDLNGVEGCTVFAVFDGHRGFEAADYLAASLESHLLHRWASSTSAEQLLRDSFVDADEAFRAQHAGHMKLNPSTPHPHAGSTAAVALLVGHQLTIANVGDSRIMLCQGTSGTTTFLTNDQTGDREDERVRIQAAGGAVRIRLGQWRVGDQGLQVTRSIGDSDLKPFGVIAHPETSQRELTPQDEYLVVASDGLWERMEGVDVLELVQDTVKQPAMCAQRLVMEALARGSQDNVSCVFVILDADAIGTAERVYHGGRQKYGPGQAAKRVAARMVEDEMRDTY